MHGDIGWLDNFCRIPLPCSYGCTWLLRRFTFKLSPGQENDKALGLRSFFTLGPAEGIFVTPVQRHEE